MKLLKWALIAALVSIVLVLGAAAIALFGVDPNRYKPRLESLAAEQNVTLRIAGDLSWDIFPGLGIHLGETQIEDHRHRFPTTSFRSANLELGLMELVRGNLAVKAVAIEGADIRIETTGQAKAAAAAPIAAAPAPGTAPKAMPPKPDPGAPAPPSLSVAIENFSLTDSRITLPDDGAPKVLANLELTGKDLNLAGDAFDIRLTFDYEGSQQLPVLGNKLGVDLAAQMTADQAKRLVTLSNTKLTITPATDESPLTAAFDLKLDYGDGSLALPKLKIMGGGATLTGKLDAQQILGDPTFQGQLTLTPTNLRDIAAKWGMDLSTLPSVDALTQVSLSADINGAREKLVLDKLQVRVDQSNLRGRIALGLGATRSLDMALQGDSINLDDYIASGAKDDYVATGAKNKEQQAATAVFAPVLGALAWLKGGSGKIDIQWDSLTLARNKLDKLHLGATARGKRVELADLSAQAFDGAVKLAATIDMSSSQPKVNFTSQVRDIAIAKAGAAFATNTNMEGVLDLAISGNTQGQTTDALSKNLAGSGTLHITKPVITAVNVERHYCEVAALVEGTTLTQDWAQGTALKDLDSAFHLAGYDLVLDSYTTGVGNLGLKGNGVIDTDKEHFNILAIARLSGDRTSEAGCVVKSKSIRDRDIALRCKDSFAKAGAKSCRPDGDAVKELAKTKAMEKLQDKLQQKIDDKKLDESTGQGLNDLLQGILNRNKK